MLCAWNGNNGNGNKRHFSFSFMWSSPVDYLFSDGQMHLLLALDYRLNANKMTPKTKGSGDQDAGRTAEISRRKGRIQGSRRNAVPTYLAACLKQHSRSVVELLGEGSREQNTKTHNP